MIAPRVCLRAALRAAPALLFAGGAAGQTAGDGEPLVITPQVQLEPLRLDDIDVALELEWRRDVDDVEPRGGFGQRNVEDRLREIMELRTTGFIGHPNLIELDLGGRIWLEQRWLDVDDMNTRVNQDLYEWDVSAFLVRESQLPVTLYTRQNISDVDRPFGAALENTFRETGGRLSIRDDVFPTNVQVFRREIIQEDRLRNQDFDVDQKTLRGDGRIELGLDQRIAWDVEYDDIDESGELRLPRSFDRFEANATHTVEFGEERRNTLRTRLRLYDESGDRTLRQVRVDPRLRLWHTDSLRSWYDYSFGRDDRFGQEQRTHRVTGNVQHDVFDSLTTIGTVGFDRLEIPTDAFTREEIFARADADYRKRVAAGTLNLGLDGALSTVDQSETGVNIVITDDLFIFDAGDLIVIPVRNVVASSITVRNATGIVTYTEGADYIVRALTDFVEIQRLAGGDIAPGEAVRVDYIIGPEPGGRTDTRDISVEARYTLEEGLLRGLAGYAQYRRQEESRDFQSDDFLEDDFEETRYGLEFNRSGLYLRAERQRRTGSLSPFTAWRLEGRYARTLGPGSKLVLSGIFQEIERDLVDLRSTTTTLSGQWIQRVDQRLRFALIGRYNWADDNANLDSESFEQQLDVVWRRGRTEVYAQIRNTIRMSNVDDTTRQRFIVGLRREF